HRLAERVKLLELVIEPDRTRTWCKFGPDSQNGNAQTGHGKYTAGLHRWVSSGSPEPVPLRVFSARKKKHPGSSPAGMKNLGGLWSGQVVQRPVTDIVGAAKLLDPVPEPVCQGHQQPVVGHLFVLERPAHLEVEAVADQHEGNVVQR